MNRQSNTVESLACRARDIAQHSPSAKVGTIVIRYADDTTVGATCDCASDTLQYSVRGLRVSPEQVAATLAVYERRR